jgi:hypothetical protein
MREKANHGMKRLRLNMSPDEKDQHNGESLQPDEEIEA